MIYTIAATFCFGALALIWNRDGILNTLLKIFFFAMTMWGMYEWLG